MAEKKLKKSELKNIINQGWSARRTKIQLQRAKQNQWAREWLDREKFIKDILNKSPEGKELIDFIKRQEHYLENKNKK
jgi:hypothetical protein